MIKQNFFLHSLSGNLYLLLTAVCNNALIKFQVRDTKFNDPFFNKTRLI